MGIKRHNVIFAGIGGMGALTSGKLIAKAAMKKYKHVTWYPNITTARRNAPADCLVCFSDAMIYSQLVSQVETAVVMNNAHIDVIISRIKKGGLLITEEKDFDMNIKDKDIEIVRAPALKVSSKISNPKGINIIFLGIYVGKTEAVAKDFVEIELKERFKRNEDLLKINFKAFEEGVKIGRSL